MYELVHGQQARQHHVQVEEVGAEADQVRHHLQQLELQTKVK